VVERLSRPRWRAVKVEPAGAAKTRACMSLPRLFRSTVAGARRCAAPVVVPLLLLAFVAPAPAAQAVHAFEGLAALCAQPLEIVVRQPTVAEWQVSELLSDTALAGTYVAVNVGAGIGMVEAGMLPTLANLTAVAFGVVLPLTFAIAKGWEQAQRRTLERAITETRFVPIAEAALRRRLPAACTQGGGPGAAQLELLVVGYGLRGGTTPCVHALAHATLRLPGREAQTLRVAIGEPPDDPDLPVPYCAEVAQFLADDGAALRRGLEDAALTLGAYVARKLQPPR